MSTSRRWSGKMQVNKRLLDYLSLKLPENYYIVPNVNLPISGPNNVMKYWEYDCIVIAPSCHIPHRE